MVIIPILASIGRLVEAGFTEKENQAMRTQLLIGGAMVAATIGLIWASSARSADYYDPPNPGQIVAIPQAILCDTRQQIEMIAQAGKDDNAGLQAAFNAFSALKDEKGEPTCAIEDVRRAMAAEIHQVGLAHGADEGIYMTWAVELKGDNGASLWMLLSLKEKEAASEPSKS